MSMSIQEIKVGQSASHGKTITEADIKLFADLTGDANPVHMDEEYAKQSIFNGRVAHGMLGAGLISTVFGMYLPGPGTVYLSQTLQFLAPVRIGDTITATCTVKEKIEERKRLIFDCKVTNQDGVDVIKGEAIVKTGR